MITVADKILLHLRTLSHVSIDDYNMPYGFTQDGIGEKLGISRAHVSVELSKLVRSGLIDRRRSHVRSLDRVRWIFHLTPLGIAKADKIPDKLLPVKPIEQIDSLCCFEIRKHELLYAKGYIDKADAALSAGKPFEAIEQLSLAIKKIAASVEVSE